MSKNATIGLVVPHAEDKVPAEGHQMYPNQRFIPKGVGVRSLTPEGYAAAFDAIMPAAEHLVKQNVDAIMVIGTSLTFYRGPEAHDRLLEKLRATTGLPVSTMSQAILDGLKEVGAKRVAVTTAYTDVVNQRLKELLTAGGYEVLSLEAFHILEFGGPSRMSEGDIIDAQRQVGGERARRRRGGDLVRRPAHARGPQAAGGAPRAAGRLLDPGRLLGGDAAGGRERPRGGPRPAAGTSGPCALGPIARGLPRAHMHFWREIAASLAAASIEAEPPS